MNTRLEDWKSTGQFNVGAMLEVYTGFVSRRAAAKKYKKIEKERRGKEREKKEKKGGGRTCEGTREESATEIINDARESAEGKNKKNEILEYARYWDTMPLASHRSLYPPSARVRTTRATYSRCCQNSEHGSFDSPALHQ